MRRWSTKYTNETKSRRTGRSVASSGHSNFNPQIETPRRRAAFSTCPVLPEAGRRPRPTSGRSLRATHYSLLATLPDISGDQRQLAVHSPSSELSIFAPLRLTPNASACSLLATHYSPYNSSTSSGAGSQPFLGNSAARSPETRLFSWTSNRSTGVGRSRLCISTGYPGRSR